MIPLKQQLYSFCQDYVEKRISECEEAIRGVQLSANEETKSSAGDKYETGRAMAQLEIEKNMTQMAEIKRLRQVLEQMSWDIKSISAQLGSLVLTNHGNFYLAISAGQCTLQEEIYFAISTASPIGQKLKGLRANDFFSLNGKTFTIQEVI